MLTSPNDPGARSLERLRAHYEIERHLASKLREADKSERRQLYTTVYDELFRSVPDHPQITGRVDPVNRAAAVARQLGLLESYLFRDSTFVEIGAGDCALAFAVAGRVALSYGVDVSAEIAKSESPPDNFKLILSDGSSIPLPTNGVDVAYSNQLMEHLHPDDALDQLREILRILRPGGVYLCITPNRLSGPHDISRYFSDTAQGLHLREYSAGELCELFQRTGFTDLTALVGRGNRTLRIRAGWYVAAERALAVLPQGVRRRVTRNPLVTAALGIKLFARKPTADTA
ncbi:MAG: class I SAM-dependent methyltransferase [Vulcanimicrobiaceae bacterium]